MLSKNPYLLFLLVCAVTFDALGASTPSKIPTEISQPAAKSKMSTASTGATQAKASNGSNTQDSKNKQKSQQKQGDNDQDDDNDDEEGKDEDENKILGLKPKELIIGGTLAAGAIGIGAWCATKSTKDNNWKSEGTTPHESTEVPADPPVVPGGVPPTQSPAGSTSSTDEKKLLKEAEAAEQREQERQKKQQEAEQREREERLKKEKDRKEKEKIEQKEAEEAERLKKKKEDEHQRETKQRETEERQKRQEAEQKEAKRKEKEAKQKEEERRKHQEPGAGTSNLEKEKPKKPTTEEEEEEEEPKKLTEEEEKLIAEALMSKNVAKIVVLFNKITNDNYVDVILNNTGITSDNLIAEIQQGNFKICTSLTRQAKALKNERPVVRNLLDALVNICDTAAKQRKRETEERQKGQEAKQKEEAELLKKEKEQQEEKDRQKKEEAEQRKREEKEREIKRQQQQEEEKHRKEKEAKQKAEERKQKEKQETEKREAKEAEQQEEREETERKAIEKELLSLFDIENNKFDFERAINLLGKEFDIMNSKFDALRLNKKFQPLGALLNAFDNDDNSLSEKKFLAILELLKKKNMRDINVTSDVFCQTIRCMFDSSFISKHQVQINQPNEKKQTSLQIACKEVLENPNDQDAPKIVKSLLDNKADINLLTEEEKKVLEQLQVLKPKAPQASQVSEKESKIADGKVDDKQEQLDQKIKKERKEKVTSFIENSVFSFEKGGALLLRRITQMALHYDEAEINEFIEQLLKKNADFLQHKSTHGHTLLWEAIDTHPIPSLIAKLIEKKANVNEVSSGAAKPKEKNCRETPLQCALRKQEAGVVELLIEKKANLSSGCEHLACSPLQQTKAKDFDHLEKLLKKSPFFSAQEEEECNKRAEEFKKRAEEFNKKKKISPIKNSKEEEKKEEKVEGLKLQWKTSKESSQEKCMNQLQALEKELEESGEEDNDDIKSMKKSINRMLDNSNEVFEYIKSKVQNKLNLKAKEELKIKELLIKPNKTEDDFQYLDERINRALQIKKNIVDQKLEEVRALFYSQGDAKKEKIKTIVVELQEVLNSFVLREEEVDKQKRENIQTIDGMVQEIRAQVEAQVEAQLKKKQEQKAREILNQIQFNNGQKIEEIISEQNDKKITSDNPQYHELGEKIVKLVLTGILPDDIINNIILAYYDPFVYDSKKFHSNFTKISLSPDLLALKEAWFHCSRSFHDCLYAKIEGDMQCRLIQEIIKDKRAETYINDADTNGMTALSQALNTQAQLNPALIRLLLESKADPNSNNIKACLPKPLRQVIGRLLRNNIFEEKKDLAYEAIELLLEHKADPHLACCVDLDHKSSTPMDLLQYLDDTPKTTILDLFNDYKKECITLKGGLLQDPESKEKYILVMAQKVYKLQSGKDGKILISTLRDTQRKKHDYYITDANDFVLKNKALFPSKKVHRIPQKQFDALVVA